MSRIGGTTGGNAVEAGRMGGVVPLGRGARDPGGVSQ